MESNVDIDSLALVPKEITSSTLTTRLKGICKINRLVDHINELNHHHHHHHRQHHNQQLLRHQHNLQISPQQHQQTSQQSDTSPPPRPNTPAPALLVSPESASLNHEKFQSNINSFREWVIENKIIEHIFGPNCHVEIIKQSHTILNFVAYSLDEDHVDVIWTAASLKHCGRQVLDLLTSLIRFMKTGPVLHLYELVKSLNIEDHSEHTLLLASHILRYIWNHSPCINHIQLCNFQNHNATTNTPTTTTNLNAHISIPPTYRHNQNDIEDTIDPTVLKQQHHQQQQQQQTQLNQTTKRQGSTSNSSKNLKLSVVEHILKTISDSPSENKQKSSQDKVENTVVDDKKWLNWQQSAEDDSFFDNYSDVEACCSEDKNMDDFEDDDLNDSNQDDNNSSFEIDAHPSNNDSTQLLASDDIAHSDLILGQPEEEEEKTSSSNDKDSNEDENSSSDSIDSELRFPIVDQAISSSNLTSSEAITLFKELKKTSNNLSFFTKQFSSDEDLRKLADYNLTNLCEPGKTLLWDLLQDGQIDYLSLNLNLELENVLVNLVMSFGDRNIRYKFIEACLENLTIGKSVTISLRLAPKLMSFNTITRNLSSPAINETHAIVSWAEQEYHLSQNFFKNLVQYYNDKHLEDLNDETDCKNSVFSHIDEVITRMSFLTFIYSKPFSPDSMKLSQEQIDQLWACLATDFNPRCSDVLFQWIYQQAVGEDFHGINDELLDYILKCKLPSLEPDHFRLRGLKLLEQLLWIRQDYECCHSLEHPATRLLWDIGLRATDDEVSMAAIRILNHFYIYTNHQKPTKCDKGLNFMNHCMEQLQHSLENLNSNQSDTDEIIRNLDMMQKVILLIRTHLEVFKAHWSYYLRILQLNNEVDLVSHRSNACDFKLTMTIRLVCQASTMDKTTIEMQAGDFVGELRAEIVKWWYSQVDRSYFDQQSSSSASMQQSPKSSVGSAMESDGAGGNVDDHNDDNNQRVAFGSAISNNTTDQQNTSNNHLSSFTEFLLANQQSVRLLSHQQEIPLEWDERQINELDFKDMQVIFVSGDMKASSSNVDQQLSSDEIGSDKSAHETLGNNSCNYIPKSEIPSMLLLRQACFDRLMEVDRYLGTFRCDSIDLVNRAKALSKRVWEIIQILPTSPNYKLEIRRSGVTNVAKNCTECPQKLLYSLQTIDILKSSHGCPSWGSTFIQKGGLADIYDIFMSKKLLPDQNNEWNESLQECLSYLLKLIFQFGTRNNQANLNDTPSSTSSSSRLSVSSGAGPSRIIITPTGTGQGVRKTRRNRARIIGSTDDCLPIPILSDELLELLHKTTDQVFKRLIRILECSAFCKNNIDHYYFVGISSRAMIVHHVMNLLASWYKSDPKFPKFQVSNYENLLKALILDDYDTSTRRETCSGLYKLHHVCSTKIINYINNFNRNTIITNNPTTSLESIHSMDTTSKENNCDNIATNSYNNKFISTKHQSPSNIDANSLNSMINKSNDNRTFSADLLQCLIKFLPIAEAMRPPKPIRNYVMENDYIKELNVPSCKDYFWLTCRLIDSSPNQIIHYCNNNTQTTNVITSTPTSSPATNTTARANTSTATTTKPTTSAAEQIINTANYNNLNQNQYLSLCEYLVNAIRKRRVYETRDYPMIEDDSLRGMLSMMVMAIKRDPVFRYTNTAYEFISELYKYLFSPPNQNRRYLPKCKSSATRSTAFELMITLVERCPKNYFKLLKKLITDHHNLVVKNTYPIDYWPHEDCRSEVGFVGLINLGATCYLATCMQHLFMIPTLRYAVLSIEDTKNIRHGEIIRELQKIFTFLLESERKAYNPKNFCKVYTMDNHPLNITEQTDMTEFFTDLITKLEESSPELKQIIKGLFSGTLSNNVVSLDCPHISRTSEEFYTLRVQVADMRSLNDSLDELTIKDTLDGDNMYTCSTCQKKVRAEKRACIVKLPRILCFNTMRYTFNMATMQKEKVNTHFSFPMRLDMTDYLEENLMKQRQQQQSSGTASASSDTSKDLSDDESNIYELIGVTVHTGNADGGHYYCFIRDCEDKSCGDKPRWYLFNDAEVKPFDDSHIGTECYGGELTTKSYDAINDRFMDFSIEKTNSAYMLFYKRVDYKYYSKSVAQQYLESDTEREPVDRMHLTTPSPSSNSMSSSSSTCSTSDESCNSEAQIMDLDEDNGSTQVVQNKQPASPLSEMISRFKARSRDDGQSNETSQQEDKGHSKQQQQHYQQDGQDVDELMLDSNAFSQQLYEEFQLPKHLVDWIWTDNMKFHRDKNVFEHNYFNFMWQLCANIPKTLNQLPESLIANLSQSNFTYPLPTTKLDLSFTGSEDRLAIRSAHLAITFVLGVLMNSRERSNLSNWTELIRKQFNSSKAACDWLMQLIDEEDTWLKQMLYRCPIDVVRQLFQRLCNDLTGTKQHKKLRLIR